MPDLIKTAKCPMLIARGQFIPASLNAETRTLDVIWTTGASVMRRTWDGDYLEELDTDPKSVRLGRLNSGAPFLAAHDSTSLSGVIGVVESAEMRDGQGFARIRFSANESIDPIFRDVKDGILRNISVGYAVHRYEVTESADSKIPTYRAVDWEPMELSLVPVGADAGAQIRSSDHLVITEFVRKPAAPASTVEIEMADEDIRAADKLAADKLAAERAAGTIAERTRVAEITALVRKAGLETEVADSLINSDATIDAARSRVIDALFERQALQPETQSHVRVIADTGGITRRSAMEMALSHRINPTVKLETAALQYRGARLIDMAADCIRSAGGEPRGLTPREIAQASMNCNGMVARAAGMHSTSDFPLILANTVSKTLRDTYALAVKTFPQFTRQTTLPDFKAATRVALGDLTPLQKVNEGGEYRYGTFGEEGSTIQLVKYGEIIAITWEAIINDDLSAFTRIPQRLGLAGAQLESKVVYDLLLSNPTMADGVAVFHATHGNLAGTGTAITVASLAAARQAMRNQTSLGGNYLNVEPRYLVVGPAKELEAYQFTSSNYVPATAGNINPVNNTALIVVVDPRITDNRWYLFAQPGLVDTIEYAYLEGEAGMFIETREGFEVDGMEIKGRLVFGAAFVDYRGAYLNTGA